MIIPTDTVKKKKTWQNPIIFMIKNQMIPNILRIEVNVLKHDKGNTLKKPHT